MVETNPRFETDDDALLRRLAVPLAQPGPHGPQAPARRKIRLVSDLAGKVITMMEEPEALPLDIEPAYPATKNLLKAVYVPEGQRVEYTVDDIASWLPGHYEQRRLTASQATAFSNTEALRGKSGPDLVKHLSRYLRSIFQPSYGPALSDRVEALSKMVREESGGELTLSGESLENLIAFLERNVKLKRPSIVAGPSGELIAIWKGGPHGEFTARFMPDGTIRYLLTRANPRHPQGVSRLTGDTTPDKLFEDAGLNKLRWMAKQ